MLSFSHGQNNYIKKFIVIDCDEFSYFLKGGLTYIFDQEKNRYFCQYNTLDIYSFDEYKTIDQEKGIYYAIINGIYVRLMDFNKIPK